MSRSRQLAEQAPASEKRIKVVPAAAPPELPSTATTHVEPVVPYVKGARRAIVKAMGQVQCATAMVAAGIAVENIDLDPIAETLRAAFLEIDSVPSMLRERGVK